MSMIVIPLRALIASQDRYTEKNSLPHVLGDGYLYLHCDLFTSIRDAVMARGYRFVEQESELWHDYLALPLVCLKSILTNKTIPHFDNVSVLRKLYRERPEVELPTRLVYEVIRKNYVFHESCHCLAHEVIQENPHILEHAQSAKERFVLEAFLQEAFANTVERMTNIIVPSKSYAFFMNLNSYMSYRADKQQLWQSAVNSFGTFRLFSLIFLSYLNQNLQSPQEAIPQERLVELAWDGLQPTEEGKPLLKPIITGELVLSEVFREETTRGYFRLYDCDNELTSIRKEDLLQKDAFAADACGLLRQLFAVAASRRTQESREWETSSAVAQ